MTSHCHVASTSYQDELATWLNGGKTELNYKFLFPFSVKELVYKTYFGNTKTRPNGSNSD